MLWGAGEHARVHFEPLIAGGERGLRKPGEVVRRRKTKDENKTRGAYAAPLAKDLPRSTAQPVPESFAAMSKLTRRTDCEGFHRRDFAEHRHSRYRSGSRCPASSPPRLAPPPRAKDHREQSQGQERHPAVARRRPGHHRHVGQQAGSARRHPRRVQIHRHQRHRRAVRRNACRRWRRSPTRLSVVRSLYHTIPSHGPAAVFMTTGNKPTAALAIPGARVDRLEDAQDRSRRAAIRHVQRSLRGGRSGLAGYLGTGYNPFIIEGNAAAATRPAEGRRLQRSRPDAQGHVHARRTGKARRPASQVRQRLRWTWTSRTTSWTVSTRSTSRRSKSSRATRPVRRST